MDAGAAPPDPRAPHGAAAPQRELGAARRGRAHRRGRLPGAHARGDRRRSPARRDPLVRAPADRARARARRDAGRRRRRRSTSAARPDVRLGEPAFVGREAELAAAATQLGVASRAEESRRCSCAGPPGIGKSAFCREVVARAREGGWRVVTVKARDAGAPYGPLGAAVEQLLVHGRASLDALPQRTRSILAELSPLARPAPPLQGALTRHQVVAALQRALALAQTRVADGALRRGRAPARRGDRRRPAPARRGWRRGSAARAPRLPRGVDPDEPSARHRRAGRRAIAR